MTDIRHHQLAQLSDLAFQDTPAALPEGFRPLTAAELGIAIDEPGEAFSNGIYRNANAQALVAAGTLGGEETIVIAFRGADERQDSIDTLQNPNAAYPAFDELIAAVDAVALAPGGVTQVAVTGHSLGGSLAQLFMVNHPAVTGEEVNYFASTTGSPGALIEDGPDPRVTNFVVADDPAVFLGENRTAVGDTLEVSPDLADATARLAADTFPGLTQEDALASIPSFTTNYENRGETVILPGKTGGTSEIDSVAGLLAADPGQHDISLYIQEIGEQVNGTPSEDPPLLADLGDWLQQNADSATDAFDRLLNEELPNLNEGRGPAAYLDTAEAWLNDQEFSDLNLNPLRNFLQDAVANVRELI